MKIKVSLICGGCARKTYEISGKCGLFPVSIGEKLKNLVQVALFAGLRGEMWGGPVGGSGEFDCDGHGVGVGACACAGGHGPRGLKPVGFVAVG